MIEDSFPEEIRKAHKLITEVLELNDISVEAGIISMCRILSCRAYVVRRKGLLKSYYDMMNENYDLLETVEPKS